jgi:hypothetical protein
MRTNIKISDSNKSFVTIDKRLDKLNGKVLFPEKLEKVNQILKTVGIPNFETLNSKRAK